MTQKELHEKLGSLFTNLDTTREDGKYSEKLINTAKVMSAVAKQMIQSADVSIRASKLLNDKTLLQGIFQ
jgi:hypothetical protein